MALLVLLAGLHLGMVCEAWDGITFIGDSNTQGTVGGGGAPYVQIVANAHPARVRNAGCNSGNTSTWLTRLGEVHLGYACPRSRVGPANTAASAFDVVLAPRLPGVRWVFVNLGAGDALFTGQCLQGWTPCDDTPNDPDTFEANLRALVALIEAAAPPTLEGIVLAVPTTFASPLLEAANDAIDTFAPRIAEVCADTPIARCGPDLRGLLDSSHYHASDILHPNSSGHAILAAAFLDAIEGLE